MFDVAIIGAGVIGAAVARELTKYKVKVIVLDKENDVACGTSKANSAIVHAGYDAPSNTLKGIYNKKGNDMFGDICSELDVDFERVGSYVVAYTEDDIKTLERLKKNGEILNIEGLEIISQEEIRRKEPNLSKDIIAALYAKTAGITDPWGLTIAYMENAMDNGAELRLNFEVEDIKRERDFFIINSKKENIKSKIVVNAAGLYACEIYNMVAETPEFSIYPRRGQYFLLDKTVSGLVNSVIFQCPGKMGKGVLIAPTVEGNIIIGPDSEDLSEDDKDSINTSLERLEFVKRNASRLVADIPFKENITTFAGLRAETKNGDFIIGESKVSNFYNIAGMKSPGLSSAPAIAVDIAEEIKNRLKAEVNTSFIAKRKAKIKFMSLSDDEKNEIIKKDPRYGKIICRCENITEGEIVDVINRNCGAKTVNGVKRRVRPGGGRCQGGFCGPRVIEILARELNIDQTEVCLESKSSRILTGETKDGE